MAALDQRVSNLGFRMEGWRVFRIFRFQQRLVTTFVQDLTIEMFEELPTVDASLRDLPLGKTLKEPADDWDSTVRGRSKRMSL